MIGRFERYERKVGRTLNPTNGVGQHFNQMLTQVVYPHPAEDELYSSWEKAVSGWRGFSFERPEALAAEMAVTWLEELKAEIASGDVRAVYDRAVLMPEDRLVCECLEPSLAEPYMSDYRWLRYFHLLHELFNLAVWEILDMAGLMQWMRLELEFELAAKHPELEGFGRHVRVDYACQRRSFFRLEGPSEQWIGWRASHRR